MFYTHRQRVFVDKILPRYNDRIVFSKNKAKNTRRISGPNLNRSNQLMAEDGSVQMTFSTTKWSQKFYLPKPKLSTAKLSGEFIFKKKEVLHEHDDDTTVFFFYLFLYYFQKWIRHGESLRIQYLISKVTQKKYVCEYIFGPQYFISSFFFLSISATSKD